jgi:ABC-type sulfate/molybdate transport systems ATPase subunit
VAFGIDHLPKTQRAARVNEVLELVGLGGQEKRFPHELSGGQQQRVALARALAPKPRLLLLDEPFSNLDVDLRERLAHEVRGILKAAQTTALFVTHDQLEAFAIGDIIGVMHSGPVAPVGRCLHALPSPCHTLCGRIHWPRRFCPGRHPPGQPADGGANAHWAILTDVSRMPPAQCPPRRRVRCAAARR